VLSSPPIQIDGLAWAGSRSAGRGRFRVKRAAKLRLPWHLRAGQVKPSRPLTESQTFVSLSSTAQLAPWHCPPGQEGQVSRIEDFRRHYTHSSPKPGRIRTIAVSFQQN